MEAQLYFYLEPYVYYFISSNGLILINLLDDKLLYFTDTASINVVNAIQKSSKRVALIGKSDLKTPVVSQTILHFMGDIVETDLIPLQFDSEINNLSDKEAYRKSIKFTRHGIGTLISECFVISDLNDLTSSKLLTLLSGIDGWNGNSLIDKVMTPARIKEVIDEIYDVNPDIHFFVTNPNEETLKSLIQSTNLSENIIPIYSSEDFLTNPQLYQYIGKSNMCFKLIIPSLFSLDEFRIDKSKNVFMLAITDKKDMEYYETLIEKGYNVEVYPVLTKNNYSFILSLFDWSLDDLKGLKDKYRRIKQNNLINSNIWGRIFVNPKGEIAYSPLEIYNGASIGSNFFEFFHKTLIKGDFAWTQIRNYPQCSSCCFKYLCPSPSPLEDYLLEKQFWECHLIEGQK
ncbi:MAG: hypothetical protein K2J48_06725 [Muribaculaceae bacterium]|nr:hypothetical protein [Muribaculaceae bacterium]